MQLFDKSLEAFNCNVMKKSILDTAVSMSCTYYILQRHPTFYHIIFHPPFAKSASNDANI